MSLNPALSPSGIPLAVAGEVFVLRRKGIEFRVDVEDYGRFQAKDLFFTTLRMVFVAKRVGANNFRAFDIPIAMLAEEKFNQPIFGANYLSGKVNAWRVGQSSFKMWFMEGGVGTFLPLLINIIDKHRRRQMEADSPFVASVAAGTFAQAAFVDPSDPSTMFVAQPAEAIPVATAVPAGVGNNAEGVFVAPAAAGNAIPVAVAPSAYTAYVQQR